MSELEPDLWEGKRKPGFLLIRDTEDNPINIFFVVADILAQRESFPIQILDSFSAGKKTPGYKTIWGAEEIVPILNQIMSTPEYRALQRAVGWRTIGKAFEPKIEECQWDDLTKRRVIALYLESKAILGKPDLKVQAAERILQESLGNSNPLTPIEIRRLLQEVVNRTLQVDIV